MASESESVPESASRNVNKPLHSHTKCLRFSFDLYRPILQNTNVKYEHYNLLPPFLTFHANEDITCEQGLTPGSQSHLSLHQDPLSLWVLFSYRPVVSSLPARVPYFLRRQGSFPLRQLYYTPGTKNITQSFHTHTAHMLHLIPYGSSHVHINNARAC